MLRGIGQNDQNKEILTQNQEVSGVDAVKNNPYAKIDKNLLIDETNISQDAMLLWEHEQDVKKFAQLALSDPEDNSAEALVKAQGISIDDDDAVFSLLNNKKFLDDIAI